MRSERERLVLQIVGWVVVVVAALGLVWLGYALGKRQCANAPPPAVEPTVFSPLPVPTVAAPSVPTPVPTITPLPTATPIPLPVLPTNTPVTPMVEAGPNGANIRSGPDIDYTLMVHVDPGTRLRVIGRYEDWWQIDLNGQPAWVYNGVVTAYDTDNVPEVQPAGTP
jgi:hypothetical protein